MRRKERGSGSMSSAEECNARSMRGKIRYDICKGLVDLHLRVEQLRVTFRIANTDKIAAYSP